MSVRSDNLRASSAKMIRSYGKAVIYKKVTPGTYNPATRTATPTTSTVSVRAVLSAVQRASDRDGVQVGDLKLTVSALDVANPNPGDRVIIDSKEWAVIGVAPVYCDDDPVTYKLHARRT
jgi:hypothetical protein